MLGGKADRPACESRIKRGDRHVWEIAHCEGECLSFCGGAAAPTDRPSNLRKCQGRQKKRNRLGAEDCKKGSAHFVPGLALVETVDPHTGVNGVHRSPPRFEQGSS